MTKLKIGMIPYGNLFPIFHTLKKEIDCRDYDFVEGVPTELNRLLLNGQLDLSPSSSIEYLLHRDLYDYIDGLSVSSNGRVGSVLLFSTLPIEELKGVDIFVTDQSAVSVALLKVLLREFYDLEPRLLPSARPHLEGNQKAFLLIGDDALRYDKLSGNGYYCYDLGELWHRHTSLPFVFALWIVRKDTATGEKTKILQRFKKDIIYAKIRALQSLETIASQSSLKEFMTKDEILSYWDLLDYNLTDRHLKGLSLFEGLINSRRN